MSSNLRIDFQFLYEAVERSIRFIILPADYNNDILSDPIKYYGLPVAIHHIFHRSGTMNPCIVFSNQNINIHVIIKQGFCDFSTFQSDTIGAESFCLMTAD